MKVIGSLGLLAVGLVVSVPAAPTIHGPTSSASPIATFTLSSPDRTVRFRCAVDRAPFAACASPVRLTLGDGAHTLRALAVDRKGRRSRIAAHRIRIVPPSRVPPAVRVGGEPVDLAFGAGDVWVVNYGDGSVERIVPGFGLAWVSNQDGTVSTLDPASMALVGRPIGVGRDTDGIAAGTDGMWVVSFYASLLAKVDPATRRVVRVIPLDSHGAGVLAGQGAVWATSYERGTLWKIDERTGTVLVRYRTGSSARALLEAAGSIWILDQADGAVSRLNP